MSPEEDYVLRRAALRAGKIIDKGRFMNTTHTTPEMRDAFEATVKDLFDPSEHALNKTSGGVYYNVVKCKTYDGRCSAEYAPVSMLFDLWQAAQSQPAPPVPSSVQEIMRLMGPYVRASLDFANAFPDGDMEKADAACTEAFKPLEAALTALVDENHRLKFELDGVRAMRGPLTDEEIAEIAERMEASDPTAAFWREFAREILALAAKADQS